MLKETVKDTLKEVSSVSKKTKANIVSEEIGEVIEVIGSIVRAKGLSSVKMDELVEIGNSSGIVINLNEDSVGIVLLDNPQNIEAGEKVKRTGRIADVPVGASLLGRVVNPLGNPLDGGAKIIATERYNIEREAHQIMERQEVSVPLRLI